jgi:hypothetical protein
MRKHAVRKSIIAAVIVASIAIVGVINRPSVQAQGRSGQAPGRPDLEALHQRLLPLFELAGVVFTDADERTGRLVVGVMDRDIEPTVRAWVRAQGVPFESVDLVETAPIVQVATLRDKVRPVEGGLQIRFSQFLCSLSFIATLNGETGYVTASHCSNTQGAIDGTQYYQPLNQVTDEFIGTEIADPAFFRNANGCPRGKKCRYSDANFSRGVAGGSFTLGAIAKTTGFNNGSLTIDTINNGQQLAQFAIGGEADGAVGDEANKVGRTTGWTRGPVTRTCVHTGVSGSNIVLLCQNFVENPNAVIVDAGDSGSPVFKIVSGNSVTLLGTLWGGDTSGHLLVYSPFSQIKQELGPLTTHN